MYVHAPMSKVSAVPNGFDLTAMPKVMDDHLACHVCRYDLYLQPGDGRCPECGERVAATVKRLAQRRLKRRLGEFRWLALIVIGLFIASNYFAGTVHLPALQLFMVMWMAAGLGSLLAGLIFSAFRDPKAAVACAMLMLLSVPAAFINWAILLAAYTASC